MIGNIEYGPTASERRTAPRRMVRTPISVRQRGRTAMSAALADLSTAGCRVSGGLIPAPGNTIWVRIAGIESQQGIVAWTTGSDAGVRFDAPLHEAVAARLAGAAPRPMLVPVGDEPATAQNLETLLSRREQIVGGSPGIEPSPLNVRKKPAGGGMMNAVTRRVIRSTEARHEPRFSELTGGATRDIRLDYLPARIENISSSGLQVRSGFCPEIGATVSVAFAGYPAMAGRIVWRRDGATGISLPHKALQLDEPHAND